MLTYTNYISYIDQAIPVINTRNNRRKIIDKNCQFLDVNIIVIIVHEHFLIVVQIFDFIITGCAIFIEIVFFGVDDFSYALD